MTALTEFLFPAPAKRSAGAIVRWWERRRLAYNAAVGAAGLFSLSAVTLVSMLPPSRLGSMPGEIWIPVAIFAVGANLCYFIGPTVEILIEKLFGREVMPTGPALFRMGLTFSVGLALFPTLLVLIGWVIRIVLAIA